MEWVVDSWTQDWNGTIVKDQLKWERQLNTRTRSLGEGSSSKRWCNWYERGVITISFEFIEVFMNEKAQVQV